MALQAIKSRFISADLNFWYSDEYCYIPGTLMHLIILLNKLLYINIFILIF